MSEIIGRKSAVPASNHEPDRISMVELMEHDAKVRKLLLVDVLEILTHATCERPEGKSWLLGPGEVWAAVRALGENPHGK